MNNIYIPRRNMSWWDMVSPREEEMPGFLRTYIGKATGWRTPKRRWQDLWMLKRGEMNHVMGMRKFGKITNLKGPKYQKGMIVIATAIPVAPSAGTTPSLSDLVDTHTVNGNPSRIHIAYDSDGTIHWAQGGAVAAIVYASLTTQTVDSNDHTNEWWPDNPETNEGLNWDIRYTNLGNPYDFTLRTSVTPTDRIEDTWYLLDDVSNDHADASLNGALVVRVAGKNTGTSTGITDIEIRVKDTGGSVASHNVDIAATKT